MVDKKKENKLIMFEDQEVRRVMHNEEWWFSIIDVIEVLTQTERARKYWSDLKRKLIEEGFQLSAKIGQLKLLASDGKNYATDCANTKNILRIIQSIPSKKAEPFKLWLAKVGDERIQEIENPELAQNRVRKYYLAKGYSEAWVEKRLRGIAIRQDLTSEWKERGVEAGRDFAILTDEISKASFGKTVREYKDFKGLTKKNQNLRDSMSDWELIFSMFGEKASTDITCVRDSQGFSECKESANRGGQIARNARLELEEELGKSVVSKDNYVQLIERNKKKEIA